jgi:hypothetical protein
VLAAGARLALHHQVNRRRRTVSARLARALILVVSARHPLREEAPMTLSASPASVETLQNRAPVAWLREYRSDHPELVALYDKAKRDQWDGARVLAWKTDVDPQRENFPDMQIPIFGTSLWNKLDQKNVRDLRHHSLAWTLSQFLHGEQGALLATAQLVDAVPWHDAKMYAATQVVDEARHVEVYERYLREKVERQFPINDSLKALLDQILSDPRWDMKYLGMQILVEGLALAAFKLIHQFSSEPLIKDLTHHVMRDEARHVAFGVLSLQDLYTHELSEAERNERIEFTYEACRLMRDRFLQREVWEAMALPVDECMTLTLHSPIMQEFRRLLFSRIVPNVKRLGLLNPWLRERFGELGILVFEDLPADG